MRTCTLGEGEGISIAQVVSLSKVKVRFLDEDDRSRMIIVCRLGFVKYLVSFGAFVALRHHTTG